MSIYNLCFEQKYEIYQFFFLSKNFQFLEVTFSIYLNRRVFVMSSTWNTADRRRRTLWQNQV